MKKTVKFCKDCGVCLGTIYSLGVHRFNAIQRCETCQSIHRKQQKADYQREYRKDGRTVRRLQKEQIELLQNENAILRELYRAKVQELKKCDSAVRCVLLQEVCRGFPFAGCKAKPAPSGERNAVWGFPNCH